MPLPQRDRVAAGAQRGLAQGDSDPSPHQGSITHPGCCFGMWMQDPSPRGNLFGSQHQPNICCQFLQFLLFRKPRCTFSRCTGAAGRFSHPSKGWGQAMGWFCQCTMACQGKNPLPAVFLCCWSVLRSTCRRLSWHPRPLRSAQEPFHDSTSPASSPRNQNPCRVFLHPPVVLFSSSRAFRFLFPPSRHFPFFFPLEFFLFLPLSCCVLGFGGLGTALGPVAWLWDGHCLQSWL